MVAATDETEQAAEIADEATAESEDLSLADVTDSSETRDLAWFYDAIFAERAARKAAAQEAAQESEPAAEDDVATNDVADPLDAFFADFESHLVDDFFIPVETLRQLAISFVTIRAEAAEA